jgi:hypothetical protein
MATASLAALLEPKTAQTPLDHSSIFKLYLGVLGKLLVKSGKIEPE